tara:strand:- start:1112 stop:2017 length:906 start_codon:yes stop_codon:yes gene_type:complete
MTPENENTEPEGTEEVDPNSPDAIVDAIMNGGPVESAPGQELELPKDELEVTLPPDPRAAEAEAVPAAEPVPVEEVPVEEVSVAPVAPELPPELQAAAQEAKMHQLEAENEALRAGAQPVMETTPESAAPEVEPGVPLAEWADYEANDADVEAMRENPKQFITDLVNYMGQSQVQYVQDSLVPAIGAVLRERESAVQRATAAADEFYNSNKDLVKHKDIVGAVSAQVRLRNPGKGYEEIKGLIATSARALLTKHGVVLGPKVPLATNPATPGARTTPGLSAGPLRNEDVEKTLGFDDRFPV